MNALREQLIMIWAARSPRERILIAIGGGVVLLILLHLGAVRPLQARLELARARADQLEIDLIASEHLASEAGQLRVQLERVEARIASSARTNLFTLLENLASRAGVKDQLESIKPKQPSGNPGYPETRVEVQLKGATLEQVTQLLYRIETAPLHLIVRSLRIKAQQGRDATTLDVSFSVSSFERA